MSNLVKNNNILFIFSFFSIMNAPDLLHLIQRATFGLSPADAVRFANKNTNQVIDILFEESKKFTPLITQKDKEEEEEAPKDRKETKSEQDRRMMMKENRQAIRKLNTQWLTQMMQAEGQVREKMAFFWHGHLVCQPRMFNHAVQYVNILREKGLGKFGELLLAISKSPAMLAYLNNQQNRKNRPNENFAREVLELFTLGRGNYTENDIKESARAFTGWGFATSEFVFREKQHDTGEKTFLGKTGKWKGEDIIQIILAKKETAIFLVKKIYKFFVNETQTIPNDILADLSKRYFDSEYDTGRLLAYIFNQKWFFEEKNKAQKIKSPIEFLCNLQRQFDITFDNTDSLIFIQKILGQILLYPPNVAGWAGGKGWIDSSTLLFRLRLGGLLYRVSDIDLQAKEEFDVQNKGLMIGNLKKMKANFNWENLENYAKSNAKSQKNTTENLEKITNNLITFFLPYSPKNIQKYLDTQVNSTQNNTKTDANIRQITLAIIALPEYQLC